MENNYQNNDFEKFLTKTNSQTYSNINYKQKDIQMVKNIQLKKTEKINNKTKNNINNNNEKKRLVSINIYTNNKTNRAKEKNHIVIDIIVWIVKIKLKKFQ